MKDNLRRQLKKRKQRLQRRIDKRNWSGQSPMINPTGIQYELAEKEQAIAAGGIGCIMQVVNQVGLRKQINQAIPLLKLHLPYDEADHVLNIALNLLAGGTCLDHLEDRRTDEAYLNALGAERIPDPTTAGDFCRRFDELTILQLMQGINRTRQKVWAQQPREFFAAATIELDGTMVETYGEKKQGIGMNYKKLWGYHPLVVTLAETCEVLYLANRSGNRPSHENSAFYADLAIDQCRQAGFKKILLRGDTDFALTENFDRWTDAGVEFVFGIDAMPNLVALADSLENKAWTRLDRPTEPRPSTPRQQRPNHKQAVIKQKGYLNKQLQAEWYAEFDYRPTKCSHTYRIVVLRKEVEVTQGQQKLFDDSPYFFYITNVSRAAKPAPRVIRDANQRCNQENTISQLKACGALAAPLDSLVSNWAYMAIASLAWTLKAWCGLMIRPQGKAAQREQQAEVRGELLRMEFATFRQRVMQIPAQIIRTSRRLIYRLLSYRSSVETLLLIHEHACRPLRC